MNSDLLKMGDFGYGVRRGKDWLPVIERLIVNPELRPTMGRAGRQIVEDRFSSTAAADNWARVLKEVSQRYKRPGNSA